MFTQLSQIILHFIWTTVFNSSLFISLLSIDFKLKICEQ